jgi:hypothetical protein
MQLRQFKQSLKFFLVITLLGIAAVMAGWSGCASGGGGRSDRSDRSDRSEGTGAGAAWNLATLLSGRFQAEGPGNDATLSIGAGGTLSGQRFDLIASTRGRLGDRTVTHQGVIHLESQGGGALVSYIPRFDPTLSEISPDAGRITATELSSACTFSMVPWEQGYAGETVGTTSCVRALGGSPGTWRFEVQPDMIRVTRPGERQGAGEVVVFRRSGR